MPPTSPDWRDLQLFLAVARHGGLSPAARETGRSPATLGRRMQALERAIGRDLFRRHDRGYDLTEEGRALLADLGSVDARLARVAAPAPDAALPVVKISAGTWTTLFLIEQFDALRGTPPDLRPRFASAEAVLDITHREVAIGIRNARPRGVGLAGRQMGHVHFAAYAAPGAPERWIRVLADTPSARWVDSRAGSDAVAEVTAPRNALDLALNGIGMTLLPTFVGDAQPGLERVGHPVADLTHEQWLVTHEDDRHLPEIRRAIDRLYRLFERPARANSDMDRAGS